MTTRSRTADGTDLARRDVLRTPQGQSGTDNDLALGRLINELEEVGRNEQSIEWSALGGYSLLLSCRAVKERVSVAATAEELQQAAHEALNAAIAALPTPADQHIGEAILAASKDFVGDDVKVRKVTLNDKYSISAARYKRRRPQILKLLAMHLGPVLSDATSSDAVTYRALIRNINCVFSDAAALGLCCLAYDFVSDFDRQLGESDNIRDLRRNREAITELFYDAYGQLILSAGYCLDEASYSCRAAILRVMPPGVVPVLMRLLNELFQLLPFESGERAQICNNRYTPLSDLWLYRARSSIFDSTWKLWEQTNLTFAEDRELLVASILGSCSNLLFYAQNSLAIQQFEDGLPDNIIAAVTNYYGVEPNLVLNGKSLTERCYAYITKRNPRIAYAVVHLDK